MNKLKIIFDYSKIYKNLLKIYIKFNLKVYDYLLNFNYSYLFKIDFKYIYFTILLYSNNR